MKIVLVSILTPASENIRGTSALPYHILKHRDRAISVTIYSYNYNELQIKKIAEVERELNVNIRLLDKPRWIKWIFKLHLLWLRVFLSFPLHYYLRLSQSLVNEIKAVNPDGVWIYGEEMSGVSRQFAGIKRVHTLPDCESLYYYRLLGKRMVTYSKSFYWRIALMYPKFLRMEREFDNSKEMQYHLVGEEDVRFLKENNPGIQAHFIRHPHYEVSPQLKMENGKLKIEFHRPKIKVLIAGQYNFYMRQTAVELFGEFKNSRIQELKNCYSYTFLGKGWERHVETLRRVGYEVEHIMFASDYIEEIVKHDIQITPIAIGTGTKGKVLDALANGLLVIGTPYALENIAVKHGESCIEYHQPQEVIEVLMDIPKNIQKYEQIAAEGRKQVLTLHNRSVVSQQLFDIFR